ncbi:oxidoreductase [compost metagenome]
MAFASKLPFFLTPEEGARTAIYLATSPDVVGVTGRYFCRQKEERLKNHALDDAAAERLWTWSEEQVGLQPEEKL